MSAIGQKWTRQCSSRCPLSAKSELNEWLRSSSPADLSLATDTRPEVVRQRTSYRLLVDIKGGRSIAVDIPEELISACIPSLKARDFLQSEIKRRFPGEPILVVRYGDHQPSATRDIINNVWGDDSPDVGSDGRPGPFITFYAMQGNSFLVPPVPSYDPLDIAYLGTMVLEAAGLPLSPAQRERKRLMVACEGRYFGCEPRSRILAFHRRLMIRASCGPLDAIVDHIRFGSKADLSN